MASEVVNHFAAQHVNSSSSQAGRPLEFPLLLARANSTGPVRTTLYRTALSLTASTLSLLMASAGRGAGVPAELGGESSLVSRPSGLPNKGSTPPAPPPRGRGQEKDGKLRKSCNCKNSRCLKLYCECFASGQYCFGCNCQACHNNPENDEMRKRAIEQAASLYLHVSPCISLYLPISPL